MKTLTFITAFICLTLLGVRAQQDTVNKKKTEADIYWDTMPKSFQISTYKLPDNYTLQEFLLYKESRIKAYINGEMYSRLLREWGIQFWKRFPEDPRKFEWLNSTLLYQPTYFNNLREGAIAKMEKDQFVVALDTIAKNEWKTIADQYIREIMDSSRYLGAYHLELSPDDRHKWRNAERDKFDYKDHLRKVIAYIEYERKRKEPVQEKSYNQWLNIYERKDFGLDDKDIRSYISLLRDPDFPEFDRVAQNMENFLKLELEPLQLKANTIKGEKIELKQLKGKMVLVDFWGKGCSSCIALMPEMKVVYEKYKDKGFEVLSACVRYDYKINKQRAEKAELEVIKKISDKIGADWPLVLLNGEQARMLFEKYGWQGVPQVLLLDEEGKLIHFNGELRVKGGLEKLIKQHFDRKSIENKSGK